MRHAVRNGIHCSRTQAVLSAHAGPAAVKSSRPAIDQRTMNCVPPDSWRCARAKSEMISPTTPKARMTTAALIVTYATMRAVTSFHGQPGSFDRWCRMAPKALCSLVSRPGSIGPWTVSAR